MAKTKPAAQDEPAAPGNREPAKPGYIRYRVEQGIQSLNSETEHYPIVNGTVDLPIEHHFYVLVGTSLFTE